MHRHMSSRGLIRDVDSDAAIAFGFVPSHWHGRAQAISQQHTLPRASTSR